MSPIQPSWNSFMFFFVCFWIVLPYCWTLGWCNMEIIIPRHLYIFCSIVQIYRKIRTIIANVIIRKCNLKMKGKAFNFKRSCAPQSTLIMQKLNKIRRHYTSHLGKFLNAELSMSSRFAQHLHGMRAFTVIQSKIKRLCNLHSVNKLPDKFGENPTNCHNSNPLFAIDY